ncbi:TPA: cofactor-independent phosphoglycerate mutase [Candidatus Bathyarchaeota archaeon]|nr:cofactor-independent phosphoglycerate mutase [Candidatus Bathyarchaeota archaeon]
MKFVLVIGDGMSDEVRPGTPLSLANHPYMDFLASNGLCGLVQTIPEGVDPGSEAAILAILGYDPRRLQVARGPLEAAGIGVRLTRKDLALRCNLVTVEKGILTDYSSDQISTEEASQLIKALSDSGVLGKLKIHVGVSFRHVAVLHGEEYSEALETYPPHDHIGEPIGRLKVKPLRAEAVRTARLLNKIIESSHKILSEHPVNLERVKRGLKPGNMVWLWAPGRKPRIKAFTGRFGLDAAIISAVNIGKGTGALLGMKVLNVRGATGYLDTNYEGKAEAALKALETHDMVIVHVEAPDEAGHAGKLELKVKAIEDLDKRLLGKLLEGLENEKEEFVLGVLADHATPINARVHTSDPVPFAVYTFPVRPGRLKPAERFNEVSASRTSLFLEAPKFMSVFLGLSQISGGSKQQGRELPEHRK